MEQSSTFEALDFRLIFILLTFPACRLSVLFLLLFEYTYANITAPIFHLVSGGALNVKAIVTKCASDHFFCANGPFVAFSAHFDLIPRLDNQLLPKSTLKLLELANELMDFSKILTCRKIRMFGLQDSTILL